MSIVPTNTLQQLWAFIVFPLIGAGLGVAVWRAVDDGGRDDTDVVLGPTRLADVVAGDGAPMAGDSAPAAGAVAGD